ncbi:5-carboxymethyl-2-hydroxymuconate Delta-isomerase [uncultured Paraglaciecola sp.]|uniref:5-carboxymethyl-2-hydroxymuconate Delta-isomerase n=1 Tax=uncultured Paraglaciecola sp. TaxID=1765024 RepID=UPI002592366C|nr:5-carboxymethyl-2-hydroxymuconate Delta-isomerase [uncultured Paraglaciecola sp.]
MPHCIVEYSKNIEKELSLESLIKCVHQGAVDSELFEEASIKTRAIAFEYYQTGAGDMPFIHVNVKILQGRNHQQKKMLSEMMVNSLTKIARSPVSLTVEVVDIEKVSYRKTIL